LDGRPAVIRAETPFHAKALRLMQDLAEGDRPWTIPWPCVYGFLVMASPSHTMMGEGPGQFRAMGESLRGGRFTRFPGLRVRNPIP
jgi:hypothetical protein